MISFARVLGSRLTGLKLLVFGPGRAGATPAASASPSAAKVLAETCAWVNLPTSASDVGAVPTSRTVNGHALSSDVTVTSADVGAPPTTRAVNTGTGLTGGGNLTGDRTISIAGYTGPIAKDWNETSRIYGANSTTTLKKYDVGPSSYLVLHGILVPARNQVGLTCKLVAHLASGATVDVQVNATDADIGVNAQTSNDRVYSNAAVGQTAINDGDPVVAVSFQVVNGTGGGITADIGTFRLRAFAHARGGGSVTIT